MAKVNRETKQVFWDRMDREGRRAEAEKAAAKLSATGLSKREVQEKVVGEFQPLDGTETRAWPTPNAWKCGRKPLPPRSPEERRDLDIIWAAEHFRTNPDSAPSDGKAFWLKAAQKDPDLFDRNHAKDARSRQKERASERYREWLLDEYTEEYLEGYNEGFDDGENECIDCYQNVRCLPLEDEAAAYFIGYEQGHEDGESGGGRRYRRPDSVKG